MNQQEPQPQTRATRRTTALLLGLILVVALGLRLGRTERGLPYAHHPDEFRIAGHSVLMLKTGEWNPGWFNYGSLTMYLGVPGAALNARRLERLPGDDPHHIDSLAEVLTPLESGARREWSRPSFLAASRVLTALFGTALVGLTFLLGRRLGGPGVGLVAAAALAVLPFHVRHSALATTDVPASTWALACVLAALAFRDSGRPRTLWLALACGGLTAATKYNSALVLIVPGLALLGRTLEHMDPRPLRLWGAALVIPPLAFFTAMPFAALDFQTFLGDVLREAAHYRSLGHGAEFSIAPGLPHALAEWQHFRSYWSLPFLLLGLVGAARLLGTKHGWLALSFPLLFALFMLSTRVDFHRSMLPTYPFVAVAGALGLKLCAETCLGKLRRGPVLGIAAGAALLLVPWLTASLADLREVRQSETRSLAIDELERLAARERWSLVGIAKQARIHPLDLARLSVPFVEDDLEVLMAKSGSLDAILTAEDFATSPLAPRKHRQRLARLNQGLAGHEVLATLPGRSLDPFQINKNPGMRIVAAR